MSTAPAWRVYKTVSLHSQTNLAPHQRRELPSLTERCVRFIGGPLFQSFWGSLKLLPLELQDLICECAREEGRMTEDQLKESVHPYTRSLNLSKYAKSVSDIGVNESAFDLALIVPRLQALPDQGISDWEEVTSCSVATAIRGCPNLISLNLSSCSSISLASLQRLLALPLQYLSLANTGFYTDSSDTPITLRSNTLRALDISGSAYEFNLRFLPALEELHLGNRKSGGFEAISTVVEARELAVVDFTSMGFAYGQKMRYELAIKVMLASLRKLRALSLRDCALSDDTYIDIARRCKGLRSLDLSRCPVTGSIIHQIVASAHCLDDLDVSECRDIVNPEPVLLSCSLLRPHMNVRFVRYVK